MLELFTFEKFSPLLSRSAKSTVQLEKSMGGLRPVLKETIEEIRKGYDDLLAMLAPQMPKPSEAVSKKDGEFDGIKYRVCTPVEASKSGPLPISVYTHGGCMRVGLPDGTQGENARCACADTL
jgi:acetyl esterase/lipase